jgi:hypothetical protein
MLPACAAAVYSSEAGERRGRLRGDFANPPNPLPALAPRVQLKVGVVSVVGRSATGVVVMHALFFFLWSQRAPYRYCKRLSSVLRFD